MAQYFNDGNLSLCDLLLQVEHEEGAKLGEDVPAVELASGHVRDVVDRLVDAAFSAFVDGESSASGNRRLLWGPIPKKLFLLYPIASQMAVKKLVVIRPP